MGRKTEPDDTDLETELNDDRPRTITPKQLDTITNREIANTHVRRIFNEGGDAGEQELVMQLFHLLHARKFSLDPNAIETRYADFNEQMTAVFRS